MKAILTKRNPDGSFDEVGMNNRTVIGSYKKTMSWRLVLFNMAIRWSGDKVPVRIEVFFDDNIQRDKPDEILYT